MTNEFGAVLDRSGYAPSIIQYDHSSCYICGSCDGLQRHEPFNGANREKSKYYGIWVTLCRCCHDMCHIHPREYGQSMKREAQSRAMKYYGWDREEWRNRFGKSYI